MLALAGCAGTSAPPTTGAPGMIDLKVNDGAEQTTFVGLDANGDQVGTLEFVHGHFVMQSAESPFQGQTVEGRMVKARVRGAEFYWETLGYEDTLHMPPLPFELRDVVAFAADPRVRSVLERWRVGWRASGMPASQGDEVAYGNTSCDQQGTDPVDCSGFGASNVACPIKQATTMACSGGQDYTATVLAEDPETYGYDENTVIMCCGNGTTGTYAVKTCAASGTSSSCGNIGQKCTPCVQTTYSTSCSVSLFAAGTNVWGHTIYSSCRSLDF
jgi:hypothetical protein